MINVVWRREPIMAALEAKFAPMTDANTPIIPQGMVRLVSRRLVTFDQATIKPALYISEASEDGAWQSENLGKKSIHPLIFLYTDAGVNQKSIPATMLNDLMDAVDWCLRPDNMMTNKCTLGGLVSHCYISGEIPKVPGDLDGEGMAVIPVHILMPD